MTQKLEKVESIVVIDPFTISQLTREIKFDLGVESCLMGGVVVGAIMFWGNW